MPVRIIKTESIRVSEERIRRDFPIQKIKELADDIAANGLYHPPVLRLVEDLEHEDFGERQLVAGERRLRAIRYLHDSGTDFKCDGKNFTAMSGLCPFISLGDISDEQALEAELNENLLRTDLSWQSVVEARAKLHRLRQDQAAERGEQWTAKDTARELAEASGDSLSHSQLLVSRADALADRLDNPLIRNAKSEADAHRKFLQESEGLFAKELRELIDSEGGGITESLKFYNHDIREVALPDNYFDLIIADPPYGMGADDFGDAGGTHSYVDDELTALEIAEYILAEGWHATQDSAHLFMFCDFTLYNDLYMIAGGLGWKVHRTPIIWHREGTGRIPWGPGGLRREYELILYAKKGAATLLETKSDVIRTRAEKGIYGPRKPVELLYKLINMTCLPGNRILDPCCGSGPIFPAAHQAKCEAWGYEINENVAKLAEAEIGKLI